MELPLALSTLDVALTRRRCLPFIGAGVSAWRACKVPDDGQFERLLGRVPSDVAADKGILYALVAAAINEGLIAEDVTRPGVEGAPPTWFLRAYMLASCDGEMRRTFFRQTLSVIGDELRECQAHVLAELLTWAFCDKQPNVLHLILALFKFQTIVTTNLDDCLETAHRQVGRPLNVRQNDEQLIKNGVVHPLLLKVHGGLRSALDESGNIRAAHDYLSQIVLTVHRISSGSRAAYRPSQGVVGHTPDTISWLQP